MIIIIDVTNKKGSVLAKHTSEESITWNKGRHAEILGTYLEQLTRSKTISKIGVVTGPGSFTGIRIGISIAMGIRSALGVPLFAASKFDLAWGLLNDTATNGILFPAMRGSFYTQTSKEQPIMLLHDDNFSGTWYGSGPDLPDGTQPLPDLSTFFLKQIEKDLIHPVKHPVPLYVRPPDAKAGIPLIERLLNKA